MRTTFFFALPLLPPKSATSTNWEPSFFSGTMVATYLPPGSGGNLPPPPVAFSSYVSAKLGATSAMNPVMMCVSCRSGRDCGGLGCGGEVLVQLLIQPQEREVGHAVVEEAAVPVLRHVDITVAEDGYEVRLTAVQVLLEGEVGDQRRDAGDRILRSALELGDDGHVPGLLGGDLLVHVEDGGDERGAMQGTGALVRPLGDLAPRGLHILLAGRVDGRLQEVLDGHLLQEVQGVDDDEIDAVVVVGEVLEDVVHLQEHLLVRLATHRVAVLVLLPPHVDDGQSPLLLGGEDLVVVDERFGALVHVEQDDGGSIRALHEAGGEARLTCAGLAVEHDALRVAVLIVVDGEGRHPDGLSNFGRGHGFSFSLGVHAAVARVTSMSANAGSFSSNEHGQHFSACSKSLNAAPASNCAQMFSARVMRWRAWSGW